MIINDYINLSVKVVGKTNYVLTLNYRLASCQINLKKLRGEWNYKIKKDRILWNFIYVDLIFDHHLGHKVNPKFAQKRVVDTIILPKLEEFIRDREIEKILLT